MQRRTQILTIASLGLLLIAPAFSQSRPRQFRIGLLVGDLMPRHEEDALLAGLREQGLVEGRNLLIERRQADGMLSKVPAFAQELAQLKLDAVISTCSTTTAMAQQTIGTGADATPIIMIAVADPVGQQLIASLARPGANTTGLASQGEEALPKQLGLFAAVLPARSTVAVLVDASSRVHPRLWQALEPLAARLSLSLVQVQAGRRPGQPSLADAFDNARRQQVDGIFVLPDEPFFFARRAEIVALAQRHRLPAIYGLREYVDAGGLMSYGESMVTAHRAAASYVARIAAGARPADLPVARPTVFELVVNQKTALALGLTIPRPVLLSADSVVE